MHPRERVAALEAATTPKEPYRLLVIPDDGDRAKECAAHHRLAAWRP